MIRALIVDDERLARQEIATLLRAQPQVTLVGEAANLGDAEQLVRAEKPEVIFLDIQLGPENGFELLERIPPTTRIVFVTAYQEYAVRAFDAHAVDYLLKPVQPERLAETLARLRSAARADETAFADQDRVLLPTEGSFRIVKLRAIEWIGAAGDYSEVHMADGTRSLVLKSLREWERRLPPRQFVRIHRSAIVNLDAIVRLEEWFNASFRVHLRTHPEPLVSSRRYSRALRERFG